MSSRIFVVAGNHQQYSHFIKKKASELFAAGDTSISLSHFCYVHGPEVLRGCNEVHGYFVGTFRERKDLQEIVMLIRLINNIPSSEWVIT